MSFYSLVKSCRSCNGAVRIVYDLGEFYSCGVFPSKDELALDKGSLELVICENCALVQLSKDFELNSLYTSSYGYRSSINESMVAHLNEIAIEALRYFKGSDQIKHLDIGSNDATLINLLKSNFGQSQKGALINVSSLGIDPSGIGFKEFYTDSKLIVAPFNLDLAKDLKETFDLITSIAMLYDLPDPTDFFTAVKLVLAKNGVWISEQSYFFSMVENNAFDTICHEHIEYYSVTDIYNLCKKVDLELFNVEFDSTNGGSFRVYIQHKGGDAPVSDSLKAVLRSEMLRDKEKELMLMFERVNLVKKEIMNFLEKCLVDGRVVHGYGASTKGNTLLQYFKINKNLLPKIAEKNDKKFGKVTPGTGIPIISEVASKQQKPYAYLVLPWHFKKSILLREQEFIEKTGTKFVFPLPSFEIV